ncbi:MAG: tetratricopeptide repeat protein, partial [Rhodospirillaceae bacterium]|nr:tetratricopeptide repeat protein [Rhodospirillaceae bacterium]
RGVSRGKLNKHRLALRDHKKAVGLDPDYVSAWSSICYQHTAVTKQLEDAMAACNHALRLDPKHAPSYALRAEVWHGQGQPDQAEQDFAHSLQLAPTIWGVYFNRGLFYHDTKRPGKAKQDFIKAHNLAPAWEQRKMATAPIFQGYGIAP